MLRAKYIYGKDIYIYTLFYYFLTRNMSFPTRFMFRLKFGLLFNDKKTKSSISLKILVKTSNSHAFSITMPQKVGRVYTWKC